MRLDNMLEFSVIGIPGPQGSKSFRGVRGGKGIMIESSRKVAPWRQAVQYAAIEAMGGAGNGIHGPITTEMVFTIPKPKSASKRKKTWPDRRPDLSKVVRSTEDALTIVAAWDDDARVVWCLSRKVYPGEGQDALPVPGAVIRIRSAISAEP
jgi:crossover junction endodeoxyribonuclease RusA